VVVGQVVAAGSEGLPAAVPPFPAPFRYCTAFPASGALGVVWTSQDWQGEPIKLTIVKGIERP